MHATAKKDTSDHPEKYLHFYRVRGYTMPSNPNGTEVTTIVKDDAPFTMYTDLPGHMGGLDTAPQPMEWLLVAFVGCTQATANFVARHHWSRDKGKLITLQRMEFHNITGMRDIRGSTTLPIEDSAQEEDETGTLPPSRIQQLSGTIRVFFKTPSEDDMQERAQCLHVLQSQTERRCPVANTIAASGCRIDVVWEDAGVLAVPKF
jgi:uncharacterized OsmC-like protein